MMGSTEPMMMGSPSSPGAHGQSQYLPSYLMGEPAPTPSSPRLWSGSTPSSPSKSLNFNKSGFLTSPSGGQGFHHTPRSARDLMGSRPKDKAGAPPVSGLLEHIPTSDRKVDLSQSRLGLSTSFGGPGLSASFGGPGLSTSFAPGTPGMLQHSVTDMHSTSIFSPGGQPNQTGFSKKTPPSPAQVDPFYTQGEMITPDDQLDDTWVTVFGFPAAATSFILQQFSQYGNILKHVIATDGNWMHLHFQSKLQAKKALSKNGKVFGSSIMVGVMSCIDKSVMEQEKDNTSCHRTTLCTPTQTLQAGFMDKANTSQHTPIRPLTAAYRATSSSHEVFQVQGKHNPQKSGTMISKAVEYVFGW